VVWMSPPPPPPPLPTTRITLMHLDCSTTCSVVSEEDHLRSRIR
jgi:hypothetical protein